MERWNSCIFKDILDSIELQERAEGMQADNIEQQNIEDQILEAVLTINQTSSAEKVLTQTKEAKKAKKRHRRSFLLSKIPSFDLDNSPRRVISRAHSVVSNNSNSSSKAKSNSFSAASRCTTSPSRKLARSFHPDTHIPIEPLDIYDPDLMIDERGSVMGGTPQKLLELTTNVSFQDFFYISQFLSVYKFFMTTEEVLEHIIDFYRAAPTKCTTNEEQEERNWLIRQRVLLIITKWIRNHKADFFGNQVLCSKIRGLLEEIDEQAALDTFTKCLTLFNVPPPTPRGNDVECVFLCKFEAKHLAQQLALAEQLLFQKISAKELREQQWVKSQDELSPTVTRSIRHFNKISYWIATEIVKCYSIKERIFTLQRAIQVASESIELKNFNTAMAVVCGLSLSAITRLKQTWQGISSTCKASFSKMEELMSGNSNYDNLRKFISKQHPPMIPYLGIFLKDLTFVDVGNPTYLDNDNRIINFDKLRMISNIITKLQNFQVIPYPFTEDPSAQNYIHSTATPYDEEQLYRISRIVEPTTEPSDSQRTSSIIKRMRKSKK